MLLLLFSKYDGFVFVSLYFVFGVGGDDSVAEVVRLWCSMFLSLVFGELERAVGVVEEEEGREENETMDQRNCAFYCGGGVPLWFPQHNPL